jgi:hypothetical protein
MAKKKPVELWIEHFEITLGAEMSTKGTPFEQAIEDMRKSIKRQQREANLISKAHLN